MTCVNLHAQIQRDAGKIPHEQTEININQLIIKVLRSFQDTILWLFHLSLCQLTFNLPLCF